jgi:CheY-like chemotaxis protein
MIKAKILIVEDEAVIARDISQMLTNLGHTVLDSVMTGEEAISKAASEKPDLVMMDIQLAGKIDGVTAAIEIRAAQNTPVVFLTGNTDAATLERAKPATPSAYIPKPFCESELRFWVEKALRKAR